MHVRAHYIGNYSFENKLLKQQVLHNVMHI